MPPYFELLRLPAEMVRDVTNSCDLVTVLALRRTCGLLHAHARDSLISDRRKLMARYVERPDLLWQHLDDAHAVVGGFAALGFMLRDHDVCSPTLDIYVSSMRGRRLECALAGDKELSLSVTLVQRLEDDYQQLDSHVSRTTTFATNRKCFIKVHTSMSFSAYDPIAMSPSSALINWVSLHAFACGYPALTLRRKGLGLLRGPKGSKLERLAASLRAIDFDIRSEPTSWSQYADLVPPARRSWQHACMRRFHLCPHQGRFFGDAGSLLSVFDLLGADHEDMKRQHRAPYGISLAWRLSAPGTSCDGPCVFYDPLLPEEILTLPAVVVHQGFGLRIAPVEYFM